MTAAQGFDGPLAEFAALRQEIDQRVGAQHQILSLQLTLTGAVFGFAISQRALIDILLIVPLSSFLLCCRLVRLHFETIRAGEYIREELSPRVPGGLGWEEWLLRHKGPIPFLGTTLPLLLTFTGASLLALGWTAPSVFEGTGPAAVHVGYMLVWLLGGVASGSSTVLVAQMAGAMLRGRASLGRIRSVVAPGASRRGRRNSP